MAAELHPQRRIRHPQVRRYRIDRNVAWGSAVCVPQARTENDAYLAAVQTSEDHGGNACTHSVGFSAVALCVRAVWGVVLHERCMLLGSLLDGDRKQSLRIRAGDGQEGTCGSARLLSALLPTLERADRHAHQRSKL